MMTWYCTTTTCNTQYCNKSCGIRIFFVHDYDDGDDDGNKLFLTEEQMNVVDLHILHIKIVRTHQ